MKARFIAIDTLRGLAAIIVVFYHSREINWVGISQIWHEKRLHPDLNALISYLTAPLFFGFAAVPLFFVISGYCIHRPNISKFTADPNYKINLPQYFKRRLWRIYPVLIASLLLTGLLDAYTKYYFPHDDKLGDISPQNFLLNLLTLQGIVGTTYGTNGPLWTLGMELHFYLLYPFLFWLTKKVSALKITLCIGAVSLISIVVINVLNIKAVMFLPFWFTWVVGFFIAQYEVERPRFLLHKWKIPVGLSLLLGCVFALEKRFDLAQLLLGIVFGAVLLWSVNHKNAPIWDGAISKNLARVGMVSYSLYAIHLPVLVFLRSSLQNSYKSSLITIPVLFTLTCLLFAVFLFWVIERWSLKVSVRVS